MASHSFPVLPSSVPTISRFRELLQAFASPSTDRVASFLYCSIFPSQVNDAKDPESAEHVYHCSVSNQLSATGLFCFLATVAACAVAYKFSQRLGTHVNVVPGIMSKRESNDKGSNPVASNTEKMSSGSKGGANASSNNLKRDGDGDVDPGLLKKHSSYNSYTTSIATYPSIRTFYYPHPHIEKLPTVPAPLPLLVFIHGLGGSLSQFHPLLTTLIHIGPCFGIDLPGCGLSAFSPSTWSSYSLEALAMLVAQAIEQHRDATRNQEVVLVAHSLGCSISALIASSTSPVCTDLKKHIIGLVAICPKAGPPPEPDVNISRTLLHIPGPIFDLWRRWDRRGGVNSHSVSRFIGDDADIETKKLQLRFNEQSRTPVWRRMAWGALPRYASNGKPHGGIPGRETWEGMQIPIFFVGGASDMITKATEVGKLAHYFSKELGVDIQKAQDTTGVDQSEARTMDTLGDNTGPTDATSPLPNGAANGKPIQSPDGESNITSFVFPAPASHALLYDRSTYRTLSGLTQNFLSQRVDHRLDLGWQLQHLTTSGKWDVKNLVKWQAVKPVSDPIAGTFFAMKTLREVDEQHSPIPFAKEWKGKIFAVIDISHESPVYDTAQLDKCGIQYHKLPTVSKVPPTVDEVRDFIALVDHIQDQITKEGLKGEGDLPRPLVGVHCHYGFNRTGFFVVSYLIEKKGFSIPAALEEFERQRPRGIRHEHFIDTLFVRYSIRGQHPAAA